MDSAPVSSIVSSVYSDSDSDSDSDFDSDSDSYPYPRLLAACTSQTFFAFATIDRCSLSAPGKHAN